MHITLITPAPRGSRAGTRATAERWVHLLRAAGHRPRRITEYDAELTDLVVALHAWRSSESVRQYRAHGVPVLGICYGMQTMAAQLGGRVEPSERREFGYAQVRARGHTPLLRDIEDHTTAEGYGLLDVWMSHGDHVTELPMGFRLMASTDSAPIAGMADPDRGFYGLQFHPEVTHTPQGQRIIERFLGEVNKEYAELLRRADAIFIEELRHADLYDKTSQAFAVFLPVKSVGVMGDGRRCPRNGELRGTRNVASVVMYRQPDCSLVRVGPEHTVTAASRNRQMISRPEGDLVAILE